MRIGIKSSGRLDRFRQVLPESSRLQRKTRKLGKHNLLGRLEKILQGHSRKDKAMSDLLNEFVDEKQVKGVWSEIFNNMHPTDTAILKYHLDELLLEYSETRMPEEVEFMKEVVNLTSEGAKNWMHKTQAL